MRSLFALFALQAALVATAGNWTFEVHSGNGLKPVATTMAVQQEGHPLVVVTDVRYETRPFSDLTSLLGLTENYYGFRVGYYPRSPAVGGWDQGFEVEFLHDKAYFVSGDGAQGVIQHFELTDGHNYLLANVTSRYALLASEAAPSGRVHAVIRAGLGPMITVPSAIVRGRSQGMRDDGSGVSYHVTGWGVQASAQLRYFLTPWYALSLEAKLSGASTRNPVAGGYITAMIPTVHVNLGFTIQTR